LIVLVALLVRCQIPFDLGDVRAAGVVTAQARLLLTLEFAVVVERAGVFVRARAHSASVLSERIYKVDNQKSEKVEAEEKFNPSKINYSVFRLFILSDIQQLQKRLKLTLPFPSLT
jgi:hypothetical protein